MSPAQWWTCLAVQATVLFALTGLLVRGRYRQCWSLAVHLTLVLACGSAILVSPERFWHFWFFLVKETLYAISRVFIVLEMAWVVFRDFPGARRMSRRLYLAALVLSTAYIGTAPGHLRGPMPEWHSQIMAATIWLMACTAVLVEWYLIPLSRLHRAVLMGFTLYLLVFTTAINALSHWGYHLAPVLGKVDALAYMGVVAWWGWLAWSPVRDDVVSPETLRSLGLAEA